jgi:hypothetical protein
LQKIQQVNSIATWSCSNPTHIAEPWQDANKVWELFESKVKGFIEFHEAGQPEGKGLYIEAFIGYFVYIFSIF